MSSAEVKVPRHPGIYRRGSRYTTRVRDRSGRYHRVNGDTIAEVKTKRAKLVADIDRAVFDVQSREPFDRYARGWVDTFAGRTRRGIREETRVDYRRVLERDAIPFFRAQPIGEIRPPQIKAFLRHVGARGVKPNTLRLALAPVRALFATALEDGLISRNPCTGVRIAQPDPSEDDQQPKALTDEELDRLIRATPVEWQLLVRLLSETGLRVSEAMGLEWHDLDLAARRLSVRRRLYQGRLAPPKSRYGRRTVPLSPHVCSALWNARKASQTAGEHDPVFASRTGGRLDYGNLLHRVMKPAARAAGVPWAGFHTLRHTCATRLFRAGWNPKQVQVFLGHHDPGFTMRVYVHLLPEDLPDSPFAVEIARTSRVGATGDQDRESQELKKDPDWAIAQAE